MKEQTYGSGFDRKNIGCSRCRQYSSELIELAKPFGKIICHDPFLSMEELNKKGVEKVNLLN